MTSPSSEIRAPFATPEGTRRFAERLQSRAAAGHFRERHGLLLSSIGMGTYLGEPDAATDQAYAEAVAAAVQGGLNVVDSAINYRFQRSERSVGAALRTLAAAGIGRDEILVCTKAGFLAPDGEVPGDPQDYFYREFVERGIFRLEDVAAECHCIAPAYLEDQLSRSLRNLGVECIDVFYLHNPETQLSAVARDEFNRRLREAFGFLESAAAAGKIRSYGLATWNGFRLEPGARDYLSLEEVLGVAREAGGKGHCFRFVQLPFNLAMLEALTRANQVVAGRTLATVQAAQALGVTLVASASLLQAQLARDLPSFVGEALGLETDVERALQFARSAPGITTALVGMSRVEHVRENIRLVGVAPASPGEFRRLFARR